MARSAQMGYIMPWK